MVNALLIAEKPSLERVIKDVYAKHKHEIPYTLFTASQRGHLLSLLYPDDYDEAYKQWNDWSILPFDPLAYGGWKYAVKKETRTGNFLTAQEVYANIKREILTGKYGFIIHAGDPDAEGELLVWEVLKSIGVTVPVMRFWTNDITETAVLDALKKLRNESSDAMLQNLLHSAYARSHADFRIGINLTRALNIKMKPTKSTRFSVGRVKTAILNRVVVREHEIQNFKPTTVYGIKALYEHGFDGTYFNPKQASVSSEGSEETDEDKKNGTVWFDTKKEAEDFIAMLPDFGVITEYTKRRSETYAPKLFKLSTLQAQAGKLGFSADKTLEIIQGLYDKQYLSYPRTGCEYLSSNEDFEGILKSVGAIAEYKPYVDAITAADIMRVKKSKKWINDKALESEGHSALRPTTKAPKIDALSTEEAVIYKLVCRQFLAIFLSPLVQDKVVVIVKIDQHYFRSSGKTLVSEGYTKLFGSTITDKTIPALVKGDSIYIDSFQLNENTSKCPSRFTSSTLIQMCENPLKYLEDESLKHLGKNLKIGTDATRAGIIRELIDKYHLISETREKKGEPTLRPTPLGELVIKNLGNMTICKIDTTGRWEEMLDLIRSGDMSYDDFDARIIQDVIRMTAEIKDANIKTIADAGLDSEKTTSTPKITKGDVEAYLNVPFDQKEQVKSLGARWDGNKKLWYVPKGKSVSAFPQEYIIDKTLIHQSIALNVPIEEKDEAKKLGARWDKNIKKWIAPSHIPKTVFEKWLPKNSSTAAKENKKKNEKPMQKNTKSQSHGDSSAQSGERVMLNVPYSEKDEAKGYGARWDKTAKSWYVLKSQWKEEFAKWK